MKSRVLGVRAQMETFDFFNGVYLGKLVLKHADNLSRTLQSPTISAAEGQRVAELTVSVLEKIRDDSEFDLFWELVKMKASVLEVGDPKLPRQRKAPKRFEVGSGEPHYPATVEEYYRRFYFEVLDSTINSIRRRFDQPGYRTYMHIQNLLLKCAKGDYFDDDLEEIVSFYGSDLEAVTLQTQLETFSGQLEEQSTIEDVIKYIKGFSSDERHFFSEIVTLITLILVNPATNAVSERSFSAMKRVKTYLRSTMSQECLNSLMVLHVHKQQTDQLSMAVTGNQFINKEHRKDIFGQFTSNTK